jgi:tetratricopeptide (TPR) repeat protein
MGGCVARRTATALQVMAKHLRQASSGSVGVISEELEAMAVVLDRATAEAADVSQGGRAIARMILDRSLEQVSTAIDGLTPEQLSGCRKLDLLVSAGGLYESLGKYEDALDCYLGALTASKRELTPNDKAEIEIKAGKMFCGLAEWTGADKYLKSALEAFTSSGCRIGAVTALTLLGRVYYQQGKYHTAKKYIDQGVSLAQELGDEKTMAGLFNMMGLTYALAGEQGNSICSFQDALISYQKIYDFRGIAEVYHNIARVHIRQGRTTDAASCCDKSLLMCEKVSNFALMPFVLLTKAEIAWEEEDYLACASFLRRGTELLVGWGGPLALAKVNRILGDLISRVMCWEIAEPFYGHSEAIYKSHQVRAGEAWISMASARALEEEGRADESLDYLEQALRVYQELELDGDVERVSKKIAHLRNTVLMS